MSFANAIKAAVESVDHDSGSSRAQEYREVLNELASGLAQAGVGAEIRPRPDPRQSVLYLYPRHRPQAGSFMLSFRLDGDAIIVSGEEPTRIEGPEALKAWLVTFVKLPAFVESLQILRARATEPVEARLRVDATRSFSKGDILVSVSADDQARIDTNPDVLLSLAVERIEFPGNGHFDAAVKYAVLDSAGLLLRVHKVTVVDNKLHIEGTPTTS